MTGTVYPALLIIGPLLAAILCSVFTWVEKRACYPVAAAGLLLAAYSAFRVLMEVLASGTIQYRMAGWPPPIGIELRIDLMNALVLMVVACIALVNLFASHRFVSRDLADREGTFYAVYLMFVTGILGVSATGDLFNLYVLLEITSLASYALIAMGDPDRSPLASLNYVFIGVIGASFYLLGVGYIYIMTGSLNMVDVASLRIYFLLDRGMDQDGPFPASCMAAQRIYICPPSGEPGDSTADDQSHGLCHDQAYAHRVRPRLYL